MLARIARAANAILPMTWDETKAASRFAQSGMIFL
jgi:hypothetical protein